MKDIFFSGVHHANNPVKTKAMVEHFFDRPAEESRQWIFAPTSNGVLVRTELTPVRGTFIVSDTVYPQNDDQITIKVTSEVRSGHRSKWDGLDWLIDKSTDWGVELLNAQVEVRNYLFEKEKANQKWQRPVYDFFMVGKVEDADQLKTAMNIGAPTQMRCWGFGLIQAKVL